MILQDFAQEKTTCGILVQVFFSCASLVGSCYLILFHFIVNGRTPSTTEVTQIAFNGADFQPSWFQSHYYRL